jgi:hypothetical protein
MVTPSREQKWEALRTLVRDLEEERDLEGLAAVAEMGLVALRQMCERPMTCEALYEMLERLRGLRLDSWELGDEQ